MTPSPSHHHSNDHDCLKDSYDMAQHARELNFASDSTTYPIHGNHMMTQLSMMICPMPPLAARPPRMQLCVTLGSPHWRLANMQAVVMGMQCTQQGARSTKCMPMPQLANRATCKHSLQTTNLQPSHPLGKTYSTKPTHSTTLCSYSVHVIKWGPQETNSGCNAVCANSSTMQSERQHEV